MFLCGRTAGKHQKAELSGKTIAVLSKVIPSTRDLSLAIERWYTPRRIVACCICQYFTNSQDTCAGVAMSQGKTSSAAEPAMTARRCLVVTSCSSRKPRRSRICPSNSIPRRRGLGLHCCIFSSKSSKLTCAVPANPRSCNHSNALLPSSVTFSTKLWSRHTFPCFTRNSMGLWPVVCCGQSNTAWGNHK